MQYKNRVLSVAGAAALSSVLAACGGGGGSGSSVPSTGGGNGASTPTPTPAPTPTLSASGSVHDLGTHRFAGDSGTDGAAIGGAIVIVGPVLVAGATPPPTTPAGDARATTASDGSYAVEGYSNTGTMYVTVFPPSGDTTHATLHGLAKVTNAVIRMLYLAQLTPTELTEVAQINIDRTSNGASAVVADEYAVETARASADFKAANGYYQHCIPASNCIVNPVLPTTPPSSYAPQYASPNDLYNAIGGTIQLPNSQNATENFYVGWPAIYSSWSEADAWFMAEKPTNGGHYLNIVNATHTWIGLGSNVNGTPVPVNGAPTGATAFAVWVQEFYNAPSGGV